MARSRQPSGGEAAIRLVVGAAAEVDGEGGTRDERLARKDCNDAGNAERFRGRYGTDYFFVPEIGWFAWVKTHWSTRDGDRLSEIACQKTALKIKDEALAIEATPDGADRAKYLRGWALKSGNRDRLTAMREVARPMVSRHVDELDVDPLLFNVQNGTLELGELSDVGGVPIRLRRHARRDLVTRIAPVGYDPEAGCPRFLAFVEWALPDPEVRRWVQKLFGYSLTGLASEKMLALFWGDGDNGKTVLTKLCCWLYGDYGGTIEFASLLSDGARRGGGDATPDLAKLTGKRAVFAGEPRKGAKLDDGKVKQITGGEPLNVRFLNREFFELMVCFKLVLSFNHKPRIDDESRGMWSRVRLVPFTATIADDDKDETLLDKLKAEGPGVLNWALDGYRMWREGGLKPPEAMILATGEYRAESDWFGEFLTAATVCDPAWAELSPIEKSRNALLWAPDWRLASSDLFDCYKGYAAAMERRAVSMTKFGRELTARGFLPAKAGVMYRVGLRWSGRIDWEWGPGVY